MDCIQHYRYIDYTKMAEYIFDCIEKTILYDFQKELKFIIHYDEAKPAIQSIVDMPDKLIDLIIKSILQNKGKLADRKKSRFFHMLTDDEIQAIETIIQETFLSEE